MTGCVNHGTYAKEAALPHSLAAEVADGVAERGFAQAALPGVLAAQYAEVAHLARRFFDLPGEVKLALATPTGDGFREIGTEYSIVPQRPDLNESFCVWMHDLDRPLFVGHLEARGLRQALQALLPPLLGIAQTLLGRIAQRHARAGEAARAVDVAGATYLQVNRYRPGAADRDFLQDRHEDGHLVTLQHCPLPGLEIEEADGCWRSVPHGPGHLSIMAGELLTMMTGGATPTTFHRVRRIAGQDDRISIMLFVTPTLRGRLAPWSEVGDPAARTEDVNRLPLDDPRLFGLEDTSLLVAAS